MIRTTCFIKTCQFHFCTGDTGTSARLPPGGRSNTLQALRKNPTAASDTATFFCHGSIGPSGNSDPDALNTQVGSFWSRSSSQLISGPDYFGIWRPGASPTPPPPLCKAASLLWHLPQRSGPSSPSEDTRVEQHQFTFVYTRKQFKTKCWDRPGCPG